MCKENNYYSNLQGSKFLKKKNQQKDIEVFFSLQKHYIVISIVALYQVL